MDKFIEFSKKIMQISVGIIFLVSSALFSKIVIIPYAIQNSNESDGNYSIEVKTDNYKLNQSESYPIGAFKNGLNTFLLVNNSNESIKGVFVVKSKNEECDHTILITSSNNDKKSVLSSKYGEFVDLSSNISIKPHSEEFIYYNVTRKLDVCNATSRLYSFPISIHGWKILNDKK